MLPFLIIKKIIFLISILQAKYYLPHFKAVRKTKLIHRDTGSKLRLAYLSLI